MSGSTAVRRTKPYGRHTLVLLVAGLSYVSMGISMYFYIPGGPRIQALTVAINIFPIEFWATVFVIVGIVVFISSWWPVTISNWGYALLTGLSAGWAATYLAGVLIGDSPPSNITYAIHWGLMAFLWYAISGLLNKFPKGFTMASSEEVQ